MKIDITKQPYTPNGWTVESHDVSIKTFDPKKIELVNEVKDGETAITGTEYRARLEGKPVLNANVLDYLLKNLHLIPEDWKGKAIFFWGTIYRDSSGDLYVRYLDWYGGRWYWSCDWLDNGWSSNYPAALASTKNLKLRPSSDSLPFDPSALVISYGEKKYKLVELT